MFLWDEKLQLAAAQNRDIALELCDQYALGLHSAHTSGNIHHASTPSPGWYAIDWLIRLSMLCSSMPPMLSPMS